MGEGDINNSDENTSKEDIKKIEKFLGKISKNRKEKSSKPIKRQKQTALEKINNYESVCRLLEEYLNSYIILGFDTFGNEFIIVNALS